MKRYSTLLFLFLTPPVMGAGTPHQLAEYAQKTDVEATVQTLAELVSFPTVQGNRAAFRDMTHYLKKKSKELGLEFHTYKGATVIALGKGPERLGLITHGDVQPADPKKWAKSPFTLDTISEPGRLIARGAEDDKGPIATALYAMKALKDQNSPLKRRIELIISYHEESDWTPFEKFLEKHPPPELNIGMDASYPVVVAEKGWCSLHFILDNKMPGPLPQEPYLVSFTGGAFLSQVPEDATAEIHSATPQLTEKLKKGAKTIPAVSFSFQTPGDGILVITARGKSAHSSTPTQGKNAITHLAKLLKSHPWPITPAATAVRYINDFFGTDHYGKQFGSIAYRHPFMGPLTVNLATVEAKKGKIVIGANLRRPIGKSKEQLEEEIRAAIGQWKQHHPEATDAKIALYLGEPHYAKEAPHVPVLLEVFSEYTGDKNPQPIAIGGGTQARLVPAGVNFGPSMPGVPYTGHSEHEFITHQQLMLNLKMYTAVLARLASR